MVRGGKQRQHINTYNFRPESITEGYDIDSPRSPSSWIESWLTNSTYLEAPSPTRTWGTPATSGIPEPHETRETPEIEPTNEVDEIMDVSDTATELTVSDDSLSTDDSAYYSSESDISEASEIIPLQPNPAFNTGIYHANYVLQWAAGRKLAQRNYNPNVAINHGGNPPPDEQPGFFYTYLGGWRNAAPETCELVHHLAAIHGPIIAISRQLRFNGTVDFYVGYQSIEQSIECATRFPMRVAGIDLVIAIAETKFLPPPVPLPTMSELAASMGVSQGQ